MMRRGLRDTATVSLPTSRRSESESFVCAVQKNFVKVVRAVEFALGVPVNGTTPLSNFSSSRNATMSLMMASTTQRGRLDTEVLHVLAEIVPILTQVARQLDLNLDLDQKDLRRSVSTREPLVTKCVFS